ncbi:MAG: hypothetical protein IJV16_09275 [Lachnospiraceae bacterium]|nr:hypothetical protein [Lachnospiraceae bacterium]
MSDKLITITTFNTDLNALLKTDFQPFTIYRSKGLLTHLLNRKHLAAVKYIDFLPEIIESPDYAGYNDGNIELVKILKDKIYISIKLDNKNHKYYVATMFDVKMGKIESYLKSGRLKRVEKRVEKTNNP